jgi:hypothetical protein
MDIRLSFGQLSANDLRVLKSEDKQLNIYNYIR